MPPRITNAHERRYAEARAVLRAELARLIVTAEAADTDSWGADMFRRLLACARAVDLDLEADLFVGPAADQALGRLQLLGTELNLHRWTNAWPAASGYPEVLAATEAAAGALREAVRSRAAAAG